MIKIDAVFNGDEFGSRYLARKPRKIGKTVFEGNSFPIDNRTWVFRNTNHLTAKFSHEFPRSD
jgi:hypothetical protein